jgi:hypothetical protein
MPTPRAIFCPEPSSPCRGTSAVCGLAGTVSVDWAAPDVEVVVDVLVVLKVVLFVEVGVEVEVGVDLDVDVDVVEVFVIDVDVVEALVLDVVLVVKVVVVLVLVLILDVKLDVVACAAGGCLGAVHCRQAPFGPGPGV